MQADSAIRIFDPDVLDDPYACYGELRSSAPVYRVPETSFYLVSTWDAVQEATSRTDDFSSNLTGALLNDGDNTKVFDMDPDGTARHVLATGDDPFHAQERKMVLPTLVAKRIRAQEPAITAAAQRLWRDAQRGNEIDWMGTMGDMLPMTVLAGIIGLPHDNVTQLLEWAYTSTELLSGMLSGERLVAVVDSTVQLAAYLRAAFDRACAEPADDLLGDLARAVAAGELDEQVAILMLVQLVGAGGESTAGLIGNAARLLAEQPDVQHTVRSDTSLIPAMLEETLRLESPFRSHHRHVTLDTALAGVSLPANSHLLLLWGAANRDPAAFDEPDQLQLDRRSPRSHLAFGKGVHFCVGAALARLEARIAIQLLLESTQDFSVAEAQWVPSIMVRRHERLMLRTG